MREHRIHFMPHRILRLTAAVAKHTGLGLCVVVAVPIPWSILITAILRLSPHVPWAIPAGIADVSFAVLYLTGSGWPRSTSAARRRYSRALPLAFPEFGWALLGGLAAIASLWLLLAASGSLSANPSQRPPPDLSPIVLLSAIIIGAGATALAEEVGLRGFMQAPLENILGPGRAIAATSICFVLIHLSHGRRLHLRPSRLPDPVGPAIASAALPRRHLRLWASHLAFSRPGRPSAPR